MSTVPPHTPFLYRAKSPGATQRVAQKIAPLCRVGDLITLEGPLGAGKSHFARALIRSLCGADMAVPSPTFSLVQPYEAPNMTLHHFDLYRLEDPEELEELGFWDALDTGACLVEWPDRAGDLLPPGGLHLSLEPGDDDEARLLRFTPGADWQDRSQQLKACLDE